MGLYKGYTNITPSIAVSSVDTYNFNGLIGGSLTSTNIPNNITEIRDYAFYGDSFLEKITIPNSIVNIGNYAFSGTNISSIKISENVNSLSITAFENCPNLKTIKVEQDFETLANFPWGATNAKIIWGQSTINGVIDLTYYNYEIDAGDIILTSYNDIANTSVVLPRII